MTTIAEPRYVPAFGNPDDLQMVDLNPGPFASGREVVLAARMAQRRVDAARDRVRRLRDAELAGETIDPETLAAATALVRVTRDWYFDLADMIGLDPTEPVPDDLDGSYIDDAWLADINLDDPFVTPPYGASLLEDPR